MAEPYSIEDQPGQIITGHIDNSPRITRDKVQKAIFSIKDGKVPGLDDTYVAFLKPINDINANKLTSIFVRVYNTGHIPRKWLRSTFIAISKTANAKKCTDYQIFSQMSYLLNVFFFKLYTREFI